MSLEGPKHHEFDFEFVGNNTCEVYLYRQLFRFVMYKQKKNKKQNGLQTNTNKTNLQNI